MRVQSNIELYERQDLEEHSRSKVASNDEKPMFLRAGRPAVSDFTDT